MYNNNGTAIKGEKLKMLHNMLLIEEKWIRKENIIIINNNMKYIQILFTILGNFNFGFIISKKQTILIMRIAIYLFGKCAIIKRNNTSLSEEYSVFNFR